MAKAIGYARVSTEEQATHGISLEAQTERIKAYCVMQGLDLESCISEQGVSASKTLATRPGGQKLVAAALRGGGGHVVALKLDRLFRDAVDALTQTKAWERAGVALHLIDMGGQAVNTETAMGRFFLSMMAGFAELERNLIAERTATALQHQKSHRRVYGPTPYGFSRTGEELTKSGGLGTDLVDNQAEAEVIKRIREWLTQGVSLRGIARRLNEANVSPKRGKAWYASTVQCIIGNRLHI